jgi:hypothetical protein
MSKGELEKSRFASWLLELAKKIGVLGSGGEESRAGGMCCSMACWNGSSHGKLQNFQENCEKKNPLKRTAFTFAGSFISIHTASISRPVTGL